MTYRQAKTALINNCYWQKKLTAYSRRYLGKLALASFILTIITIIAIISAPDDYQQKFSSKIMYVHVPCAWIALLCYGLITIAALIDLYKTNLIARLYLTSAAPFGALFTAVAIASGSLWGQLSWGSWWEWDARLTSFLILFLLYLLIIALGKANFDTERASRAQALLTVFGSLNLPIIKFSVDWWRSLHQTSSVFSAKGSLIASSMLWPLFLSFISLSLWFFIISIKACELSLYRERIYNLISQMSGKN